MISTTAIIHKPTFRPLLSRPCKLNQARPGLSCQFPASKSDFLGPNKRAFSKNMTELVKISAFRSSTSGSNSEESAGLIQQEAVIGGSNEFQNGLMRDGLDATLNRLSKWLVAMLFCVVVLWRHDAEVLWAAMGSVVNSILSLVLKRIFNQERPGSASKSDPGMPSSHGQSIFFAVIFAVISIVQWLGVNEFTLILSALILAFGSYLSWLRVSQGFHTISQVVAGAAFGSIFSILWFWSWDAFLFKAFISSILVRVIVVMGGAVCCLGFLVYVIRNWLVD